MRTSQKHNLIMPSTTSDNLFWAEFDAEFESTVTQIALNNTEYWKTTHCDKIPMRTSPWRGSHKTNNLLRYNHSRRYQEQLRFRFGRGILLITSYLIKKEASGSIDKDDIEMKLLN